MFTGGVKITGEVFLKLFGQDGVLKDERHVKNLVVSLGREFIASRMVGVADAVMSHLAVGTGSTAPVAGNTTLETELSRVALTSGVKSSNTAVYTATVPAGTGTGALTEAGIFNDATVGTMLCRTTFTTINKGAADLMTVTWVITIS